jgi:class 3 adenylate cyclase
VGRIGYEGQLAYTAIGNAVNLAARLCSAAIDGQILVDQTVATAVEEHMPLLALGTIMIKGYDQQVPVFAVAADAVAVPGRA